MKRGLYLICSLIFAAAITAGHAEDKKKKEAAKKKKPAAGKKKAETGIGNVPNPFLDMDVPGSILRLVDDCRELVEEIKDLESEGKEKDEIAKVKKELSEEKKEFTDLIERVLRKETRNKKKLQRQVDDLQKKFDQALDSDNTDDLDKYRKPLNALQKKLDALQKIEDYYKVFESYAGGKIEKESGYAMINAGVTDFTAPQYGKDKQPFSTQTLSGQMYVLCFFAAEHKESYKVFRGLQRKVKQMKDVEFVAVSVDDDKELAEKTLGAANYNFPVLKGSWQLRDKYKVTFLPQVMFVDKTGLITDVIIGDAPKMEKQLKTRYKKILKAKREKK